jgi:hypothetical protein
MFNLLAKSYALKDFAFPILEVQWEQTGDRLADDLTAVYPNIGSATGASSA